MLKISPNNWTWLKGSLDSVLYQVDVVAGEGCEGASFEVNLVILVIREVDATGGGQTLQATRPCAKVKVHLQIHQHFD